MFQNESLVFSSGLNFSPFFFPPFRIQLTELEANNRHQEVETTNNVREYERALSGVQQEVTAYQTVLAQTQVNIYLI